MTLNEVREKYLKYYEERNHSVIPSASLLPENDPTTLFIGSGMQPLLQYFLGEEHPKGSRITDSQKCFRTDDIEEVGDNRHTTFFEMLGNWSFGDYFKDEQLLWIFNFLVCEIELDPQNLYITVFSGDEKNNLPKDTESVEIWKKLFATRGIVAKDVELLTEERGGELGMQDGRIFYYDSKKNWWSRSGVPENMPAGEPGGPDSELFYDFGTEHDPAFGENCHPNCDCGRFVEIGNSVFMQYVKQEDGTFNELPKKNVDFGGGLERIAAASNGNADVFSIDVFAKVISEIENLSGKKYSNKQYQKSFRIIADHLRAAMFLIADGVIPSNTDQGYFVRRLLRRAILQLQKLNSNISITPFAYLLADSYKDHYPNIKANIEKIDQEITLEETKFGATLIMGNKKLKKHLPITKKFSDGEPIPAHEIISGKVLFDMFTTYGFPVELSLEKFNEMRVQNGLDELEKDRESKLLEDFKIEMEKHQELSRSGSEQKFKGGLADTGEMSVKYHTTTHLLHQALKEVLGDHVQQKGSNITPDRLRFDFSHDSKMTYEEKEKVEQLVNEKIKAGLGVTYTDMSIEEAKKLGAVGLFEEKYEDTVRVYAIGDYSLELCGGPHVKNTSELGHFRIKKEESTSAGVRRIKAVLE